MKKALITLATIAAALLLVSLLIAMCNAETVWVHGSGGSRMLDIQRTPGQVQIWDFTNGGVTVGQETGTGTYFQDLQTGKGTWIDGGLTLDQAAGLYIQQDE